MTADAGAAPALVFHGVDEARWADLARFFEHHGTPGYCWCMRWRARSADYLPLKTVGRRYALHALVRAGTPVGVLGYLDGEPVAWCSVAARETYAALERSRVLRRIDEAPVWSVVCFFLAPHIRRQGYMVQVLRAAVEHARSRGARIVEGYPVDPAQRSSGSYGWMGSPATFLRAGFEIVAEPDRGRYVARFVARGEIAAAGT
jgi:GNAT superfamily N-acetyltransferase